MAMITSLTPTTIEMMTSFILRYFPPCNKESCWVNCPFVSPRRRNWLTPTVIFILILFIHVVGVNGQNISDVDNSDRHEGDPNEKNVPTLSPTISHSPSISYIPTFNPSLTHSTVPTYQPSDVHSSRPSIYPSPHPSSRPSPLPSLKSSVKPTFIPSLISSSNPSLAPSFKPSLMASDNPSSIPSSLPTSLPSLLPTSFPSLLPTSFPSLLSTSFPSSIPNFQPSSSPSFPPSFIPTGKSSSLPSSSSVPSSIPTNESSFLPSTVSTSYPSLTPTQPPVCRTDDSGNFGATNVSQESLIKQFVVSYSYELVILAEALEQDLVKLIETALGSEIMASMFDSCSSLKTEENERRMMKDISEEVANKVVGFSDAPADSLNENTACKEDPGIDNKCYRINGFVTLYTQSTDDLISSLFEEQALNATKSAMGINNRVLYVDTAIVKISYVNPKDIFAKQERAPIEKSNDGVMIIAPVAVGGFILILLLAIQRQRKRRSTKTLSIVSSSVYGEYDMTSLDVPDDSLRNRIPVLRLSSVTISEYMKHRNELILKYGAEELELTELQVIDKLEPFLDHTGQIMGEPVVQFAAVLLDDGNENIDISIDHNNDIVGTVDAQVRLSKEYSVQSAEDIPYPHICIKNLEIREEAGKKGIASALVQAVADYALEENVTAIVMHLDDADNKLISFGNSNSLL